MARPAARTGNKPERPVANGPTFGNTHGPKFCARSEDLLLDARDLPVEPPPPRREEYRIDDDA
jgi:hypothetical protein